MDVNPVTFAARIFRPRQGASDWLPLFICPNSLAALVIALTTTQADCR